MNTEKKLVPSLRFPAFIQDGEWKEYRLSNIAQLYKGKGISKNDVSDNGAIPCIRYGELYTHYKEVIDKVTSYTDLPIDDLFMSKANDVIIPSSGETKEDIATASCVLHDNIALGGDINVIRTSNNGVFLSYYLNNAKKHDIAKIAQGISIIHLYNEQLRNLSIEQPGLKEQQKIAECLSSIDSYISSINEKVEQLKAHKKSLMQKLFPQEGKTVPTCRFPEFEKDDIWNFVNGSVLFESIVNKSHHSDLPILAITQDQGAIPRDMIDYNVIVSEKSIANYKVVEIGDFIISLRSFQGGIEYSNYKGLCSPVYIVLRKKNDTIYNDFYRYYFKSKQFIRDLNRNLEGIRDGKMVSYQQFSQILIPYPSYEEQHIISDCLSSIDKTIKKYSEKASLMEQFKKGLMQQLFPPSK